MTKGDPFAKVVVVLADRNARPSWRGSCDVVDLVVVVVVECQVVVVVVRTLLVELVLVLHPDGLGLSGVVPVVVEP